MDDAQLWDEARRGAPVEHCRRKIKHDREVLLGEVAKRCERTGYRPFDDRR